MSNDFKIGDIVKIINDPIEFEIISMEKNEYPILRCLKNGVTIKMTAPGVFRKVRNGCPMKT